MTQLSKESGETVQHQKSPSQQLGICSPPMSFQKLEGDFGVTDGPGVHWGNISCLNPPWQQTTVCSPVRGRGLLHSYVCSSFTHLPKAGTGPSVHHLRMQTDWGMYLHNQLLLMTKPKHGGAHGSFKGQSLGCGGTLQHYTAVQTHQAAHTRIASGTGKVPAQCFLHSM